MKLLNIIGIALIIIPSTSFASPNLEKIKSLASLAGMAEYCQHYYESINSPFKEAIMRDYNKKISKKISTMYTSQHEVNTSNSHRQKAYLHYRDTFKKTSDKTCKNLSGTLNLLKLK